MEINLYFQGVMDIPFVPLLLVLMAVDIVFGVSVAIFIKKNLWSRRSYFGYARKVLILVIIVTAEVLDTHLGLNGVLSVTSVLFYIFYELLSVTENAGMLGIPIPKKWEEVLYLLKEKGGDEADMKLTAKKIMEMEEKQKKGEE